MGQRYQVVPVSAPGLRAVRWWTDDLHAKLKEAHVVARIETGRSEWSSGGRDWASGPGALQVKQPGDVHRDIARDGPTTCQIITLPSDVLEREIGPLRLAHYVAPGDPRGAALHRLHDAVQAGADRLAVEVALAEALLSLRAVADASDAQSGPVRRVKELLRERFEESMTLDALAAYAGIDKFRLCRAFRSQVGFAPHQYLTHVRIGRAKHLLRSGLPATEVAQRVGMYDQSQLHRHFRRIVGTTPGDYARAASAS